ncbi:MAG: hypothetical protein ACYC4A_09285 [Desulfobulbia bacterium]
MKKKILCQAFGVVFGKNRQGPLHEAVFAVGHEGEKGCLKA